MKISCKKCNCKFKSLTLKEEEGLCINCYYKKYKKYPTKIMGDTLKNDNKK